VNNPFQITTTYRLDQIEKRLSSLEASLSLLGQRLTSQDKVTDRLVKQREVKNALLLCRLRRQMLKQDIKTIKTERPIIEVPSHLMGNKSRRKEVVAERYACWERLDRAGFRPYEIADAFSCNHGSILFAKKQGFKSGWMLRSERVRLRS